MRRRRDAAVLRQMALALEASALTGLNAQQRDDAVKVLARLLLEAKGLLDHEVAHEDD